MLPLEGKTIDLVCIAGRRTVLVCVEEGKQLLPSPWRVRSIDNPLGDTTVSIFLACSRKDFPTNNGLGSLKILKHSFWTQTRRHTRVQGTEQIEQDSQSVSHFGEDTACFFPQSSVVLADHKGNSAL